MKEWLSLGIDTASAWGSIALVDRNGILMSVTVRVHEGHGKGLSGRIELLFTETRVTPSQLTSIGVVNGPGSFTALRVGVTTAQALGMGLEIPVVPIATHDAIIAGLPPLAGSVLVLAPARKGEVFAQEFVHEPAIGWVPRSMVDCRRLEELGEFVGRVRFLAGPAVDEAREILIGLFGNSAEFVPLAARSSRGESVALLAHQAIAGEKAAFPADQVAIRYLQSHGALTISQRATNLREGNERA